MKRTSQTTNRTQSTIVKIGSNKSDDLMKRKKLTNGFATSKTNGHVAAAVQNGRDYANTDTDDGESVRSRSSFVDDEAFEKSESSIATDSNEIPVRGESIGSTSSEVGFYSSCDDYELDSLVCSDNSGNRSLLSGSGDDLIMTPTKPKVKRRRVQLMADSSEDERPVKSPTPVDNCTEISVVSNNNGTAVAPAPAPTSPPASATSGETNSPKIISIKNLDLMHEPNLDLQNRIDNYLNDIDTENNRQHSFSSDESDGGSPSAFFDCSQTLPPPPHPNDEQQHSATFISDFVSEKIEIKVHLPDKSKAKKRKRKRTNSCSFVSANSSSSSSSSDDETTKSQTTESSVSKSSEINLRKKIRRKFRADSSTRHLGKFHVKSSVKDPPKHKLFDKVFLIKNRQRL